MNPNKLSEVLAGASIAELAAIKTVKDWFHKAREKQRAPGGDWNIWMILAGRGWGKTKTGAQDIVSYALRHPNTISAVIAPTHGDLRRTCLEGPSGILSIIPKYCYSSSGYNRSNGEITLYNGSKILGFAAIEPDRLRGPQYHRAWCDELAAWRYDDAFHQLQFGLRLGQKPQMIITTTPRPTKLVRDLMAREGRDVVVTRGSTFENEANLAASALKMLKERYDGTRLGRQELYAEVLNDVEGALWTISMLEEGRILSKENLPEMKRIVVGVDPAVTSHEGSDETGIVVAGIGEDDRYYVLQDASERLSPEKWARAALDCYYTHGADRIVCEVNQGGDLVTKIIRDIDPRVAIKAVRASRGKMVRAEPIAALYEQRKVSHVGSFPALEDQLTSYTGIGGKSPDRLDALVWALTELNENSGGVYWRIS